MVKLDSATNVVVVSDVIGERGGAYRATALLCRSLAQLGVTVTCFATWADSNVFQPAEGIRIVRPWFRRGYRWDIPNRLLATQAVRFIQRASPSAVFVVGLTRICGYLLQSSIAAQLLVWELTNADPNNKFVDQKAAQFLHRSRSVLSPAATIDHQIRATYNYTGVIQRLPFWIEDEGLSYSPPPAQFKSDFLFLARREDDKGLRELIEATSFLVSEYPGVKVTVAGPGDATRYERQVRDLNIEKQVEFVSLPSREEAMNALSSSRYLVLPSYHEGYPLSLLEAAQRSIPFIATDVGSIKEVFGSDDVCRLIRSHDARELCRVMRAAFEETNDQYIGRRKIVQQRFRELSSPDSVARILCNTLKNVNHL